MNIKKLLYSLSQDVLRQETDVRTKVMNPLLSLLNTNQNLIVNEFPVHSNSGRKKNPTTYADIMVFMKEGANNYTSKSDSDITWVRENSLIAIELKKPSEKIEKSKEQATFYAMWTRCLIYIITNGIEIEIYLLKDHTSDKLLYKGIIMNLDKEWHEIYRILNFSNLKRKKINPLSTPKPVIISSNYWEDISYDEQKDITDAIKGNKLFPYNIKSCPELPIIDRLKKEIEISNYCIIKGASGCGKSITAYQLSFYYYEKGYKVFRYKNNDDEFDYNIKDLFNEKAVFIIDDFQNIKNTSIDKIIENTSSELIIIITVTDDVTVDAETSYLSTSQSTKYIYDYYLNHKKSIYKIVHKIDSSVGDSYPCETIERRLKKAYDEANSPWMFNYILRGGWAIAKNDYYQAKDNNRSDLLLLYISLKQISFVDKSVSIYEIEKILNIVDYDKEWLMSSLQYLINNKIIIDDNSSYRCSHIKYASLIVNKMSYDLDEAEKTILVKMIQQIILDDDSNWQGVSWILNEFRTHDMLFYKNNIISHEIWNRIKEKCFASKNDVDIRNSCFVLECSLRFYNDGKNEIIKEKIDLICEWINSISFTTGFALNNLLNDLLDYSNKANPSNLIFEKKINYKKIAFIINNSDIKTLGAIGYFIQRLFIFERDNWKKELLENISLNDVIKNIRNDKQNVDVWYLSHFITSIYYLNNDYGLKLYDELEDFFMDSVSNDCLETFESMNDSLLWYVFGFSPFKNKRPKKENIERVKRLIQKINIKDLASKICRSNNHDLERYARLINLINNIDKKITKKILIELNLDQFEDNLDDYWKSLPREMRFILYELAIVNRNHEPIKSLIEKNIHKIKIAEPVITYICPKIVEYCYTNKHKIDIFGFNDSWENALEMLQIIENEYPELLNEVILQSVDEIANKIQCIVPYSGFDNNEISELLEYLDIKSPELMQSIFNNIDFEKTKNSLTRYSKEKNNNKYANKTLLTICKYIIKYNNSLKSFAKSISRTIESKYKK